LGGEFYFHVSLGGSCAIGLPQFEFS
jgi:hypothetical protein